MTSDDQDLSSITDREQERSVVRMLQKYYKDNNTMLLPLDFFEACVGSNPEYQTSKNTQIIDSGDDLVKGDMIKTKNGSRDYDVSQIKCTRQPKTRRS